jgi:hypothetical protein
MAIPKDEFCTLIAEYVSNHLNRAYSDAIVVKSYRGYDAVNVPYEDFPVLKVYRESDSGTIDRIDAETRLRISYALVLPDMESLAGILAWVREQICEAIRLYNLQSQGQAPRFNPAYSADYRNMLNELTYKVHSFLTLSFTIKGNGFPTHRVI